MDLTKLDEGVRLEDYPLSSTDTLLSQLADSAVFTKLVCNSVLFQVPLDEALLQELTTFITSSGRSCYTRWPLRISSGPKVFHCYMSELLSDIPWVIYDTDDIVVSGQHDTIMTKS